MVPCLMYTENHILVTKGPDNIYLFKVNIKNTITTSVFFIVNFEHISHFFLVFLLFTLNK